MRYRLLLFVLMLALAPPAGAFATPAIVTTANIAYETDGSWFHKLDLYRPPATTTPPKLVVFVHGGGFQYSDRTDYRYVGRSLAAEGFAVAVLSYRDFPDADAHGAIGDVATSIAWLAAHAKTYGFARTGFILLGHSSGAQIVAVLATNARFFHAAGFSRRGLAAVIALSGPYDVRDLSDESNRDRILDEHIYGATKAARAQISAIVYAAHASVPLLLACGSAEKRWSCMQATLLASALRAAHRPVTQLVVRGADHMGLLRAICTPADPSNLFLLHFIADPSALSTPNRR